MFAVGQEHNQRRIDRIHYNEMLVAVIKVFERILEPHWNP